MTDQKESNRFFDKQFRRDCILVLLSFILAIISGGVGGYLTYVLTLDNTPQLFIVSESSNDSILIKIINIGKSPAIGFKLYYADNLPPREISIIKQEAEIKITFRDIVKEQIKRYGISLGEYDSIKSPIIINLKSSCYNCESSNILQVDLVGKRILRCISEYKSEFDCSLESK